jgi:hypothetical protein
MVKGDQTVTHLCNGHGRSRITKTDPNRNCVTNIGKRVPEDLDHVTAQMQSGPMTSGAADVAWGRLCWQKNGRGVCFEAAGATLILGLINTLRQLGFQTLRLCIGGYFRAGLDYC